MEPVRYAKNGDVHLAYQVVGAGEPDLVWVPGWFSDFSSGWEVPGFSWFFRRLSAMGRLILFDKRGTGQSDRIETGAYPSAEERATDVIAVMDAVGSRRAALLGVSEGGTQALLTAARHPERVSSVVAIDSWARLEAADDIPGLGLPPGSVDAFVTRAAAWWGSGRDVHVFAPSRADDAVFVERWAEFERRAGSPAAVESYGRLLDQLDITGVLSDVDVDALIVHSVGDRAVPVEQSRYLAEHLPRSRYVELPGADHLPFFEHPDRLLDAIEQHLTGRIGSVPTERVFATVLFTDIVGSTDRAVTIGDRRWRGVLDAYDRSVGREVERHGGTLVKSTGDGSLVTFADPETAVHCASELHHVAATLGVVLRVGMHCGQVELRGADVSGVTVHVAARIAALAGDGDTVVSSTLREVLLGTGLAFEPRGVHGLKGVPGEWALFSLDADLA